MDAWSSGERGGRQPPSEPPRPQPPMVYVPGKGREPAWRYKRIVRNLSKEDPPDEGTLNELGRSGWELAGMLTDPPFVYVYLKRPED